MGSETAPPSGGVSMSARDGRAVWALALGQTLGYACFFYIFAALVLDWQRDLGWGEGVIAAGPLVAILCTAGLSPWVGRWVDRGFALRVMVGGMCLGAAALALLALAPNPWLFLLAFAGLGVAAATTLYEVCFALLIRRFGDRARQAITKVTLVAGLASTLAFPAGAWLAGAFGWRVAVWVACGVVLTVMLPVQLWGAWVLGGGRVRGRMPLVQAARWGELLAKPGAWRLMALFALISLDHWMVVNLLRPLLDRLGMEDRMAILAGALIGPAQVAGRILLLTGGGQRLGTVATARIVAGALILAAAMLVLAEVGVGAAFVFAVVQGGAMGVMTILRPVLIAEINGPTDYAAAAAVISLPGVIVTALSSMIGTGLMAVGGPALLIAVAVLLAVAAFVLTLGIKVAA
ncbi:MFS transporter [Pseudotabrizicola sp. L79]|uniref:MFS transporter n=1 Tax=Pseudotabrizicola sp. L79 TaxID=3118402 RepID=UPI002F952CB0